MRVFCVLCAYKRISYVLSRGMHDIILRIKQIVSNHHHQLLHTNYVDVCDGNDAITQMEISSQRRKMCVCVCRATTRVCVRLGAGDRPYNFWHMRQQLLILVLLSRRYCGAGQGIVGVRVRVRVQRVYRNVGG